MFFEQICHINTLSPGGGPVSVLKLAKSDNEANDKDYVLTVEMRVKDELIKDIPLGARIKVTVEVVE